MPAAGGAQRQTGTASRSQLPAACSGRGRRRGCRARATWRRAPPATSAGGTSARCRRRLHRPGRRSCRRRSPSRTRRPSSPCPCRVASGTAARKPRPTPCAPSADQTRSRSLHPALRTRPGRRSEHAGSGLASAACPPSDGRVASAIAAVHRCTACAAVPQLHRARSRVPSPIRLTVHASWPVHCRDSRRSTAAA